MALTYDSITLPPVAVLATAAAELAETSRQADDFTAERAFNKAGLHLHQGLTLTPTTGGVLVPSGTRAGIVHRVSNAHGCGCEAGQNGQMCWHAALVEIVILAQSRAIPAAKPRQRITQAQVEAGRAARLQKQITLARSIAAMDEVFA